MNNERETIKARYLAYREAAREIFRLHRGVTIPEHATVQMVEDGAFVEAVVWVPRERREEFEDATAPGDTSVRKPNA